MRLHLRRVSTSLTALAAAALMASTAVLPLKPAMSGSSQRRSAMLAAGVDMMPVGTARQAERARQVKAFTP